MLYVIASDDTLKYNMLLGSSGGFDTAIIDAKTIAITTGNSNTRIGIDIINTDSRKKIKFIPLPGRSYKITCDHDLLFVCVEGLGIYKVNTIDYTTGTSLVISCTLSWGSCVSVFNDKIYYTDCFVNSMVCCDRNGSSFWTFKDTLVLKCPSGITIDNDVNVFVIGETTSNVVLISNDGKHHKQILSKEDGLHEPSAIFFVKQTRKILVANTKETAFLYSITKNDRHYMSICLMLR